MFASLLPAGFDLCDRCADQVYASTLLRDSGQPVGPLALRAAHAAPQHKAKPASLKNQPPRRRVQAGGAQLPPRRPPHRPPHHTMASIFPRWKLALEKFGWRGCWDQMFALGTVKIGGVKVGEDHHGNTYWEDLNEKHCQHRWVMYKNTWDFDAAMVPPSWHGWLCHMTDEPGPNSLTFIEDKLKSVAQLDRSDDSGVHTHLGHTKYKEEDEFITNKTQLRNRGYGVGSMLKPEYSPEPYYKQPGSETSGEGKEYKRRKGCEPWNPADAAGAQAEKMAGLRPLSEP